MKVQKTDVMSVIKNILEKYTYKEIYKAFESDTSIPVKKINCNDKYRIEKLLERSIANHNTSTKFTGLYNQKNILLNF